MKDIFKVCYMSTVYTEGKISQVPVTCFFNDINKIKDDFGLSKEEIIQIYYNIGSYNKVKNSVVKSIEKYVEHEEIKEKPKFCVHFS